MSLQTKNTLMRIYCPTYEGVRQLEAQSFMKMYPKPAVFANSDDLNSEEPFVVSSCEEKKAREEYPNASLIVFHHPHYCHKVDEFVDYQGKIEHLHKGNLKIDSLNFKGLNI